MCGSVLVHLIERTGVQTRSNLSMTMPVLSEAGEACVMHRASTTSQNIFVREVDRIRLGASRRF